MKSSFIETGCVPRLGVSSGVSARAFEHRCEWLFADFKVGPGDGWG